MPRLHFREEGAMTYKVHRFDLKMTQDSERLEQFLNGLEGEVVSIVPNVTLHALWAQKVDFLLVVEKLP
jgi:hypothetical protein